MISPRVIVYRNFSGWPGNIAQVINLVIEEGQNMISKKIILPAAVVTLIGGSAIFGVSKVMASGPNPLSGLAQAIANKFGLDQSQVQTVIENYRSQQQAQHQQEAETKETDRLDQLVTDGKITASQKQAILDELAKLRTEYSAQALQGKTKDEIKTLMDQRRTEVENWAKSVGIDLNTVHIGFFGGPGEGRMGMHRGWEPK